MVKITRPVASPVVEQDISLTVAAPIAAGDLSWIVPLVLGGVTATPPATEGEKKPAASGPIHAAGVKISCMVQDGGVDGSVLNINVFSCESTGLAITADSTHPSNLLGSFQVSLDLVLQNANVPRP
jgi:hypothetical protein